MPVHVPSSLSIPPESEGFACVPYRPSPERTLSVRCQLGSSAYPPHGGPAPSDSPLTWGFLDSRRRTGIEPAEPAVLAPPVLKTGGPTRIPDASLRARKPLTCENARQAA